MGYVEIPPWDTLPPSSLGYPATTPPPIWIPSLSPWVPYLLLVTSGGDHWRLVQSCSFEDLPYPFQGVTSSGGN